MSVAIYGIVASRAIRPLWAAEEVALAYRLGLTDDKGGGTHSRVPGHQSERPHAGPD